MLTHPRRLFRTFPAVLAFAACLGSVCGAKAAAPGAGGKILNRIPADAQWFVVANDIGRMDHQFIQIEHTWRLPLGPGPIAALVEAMNLNRHALDIHGSAALIQMPSKNRQPAAMAASCVYLIPCTHLKHLFLNNRLSRHRGGLFRLMRGNSLIAWVAQRGRYVVGAPGRRTLKAYLAAADSWTDKLSTSEVVALGQPGICVLFNAAATGKFSVQSADGVIDRLKTQIAISKKSKILILPFVYALYAESDLVEQTNAVLLVARPHSHGLSFHAFINFQKHSAAAALLPSFPMLGARPLAGLPDTRFTVAGAMATNPQALRAWFESFNSYTSKADPAMGHSQSEFLKPWLAALRGLSHPVTRSLVMLPINMNKPPVFHAVSISTSADMANHFRAHQHNLLALAKSCTAMMKAKGLQLKSFQAKSARNIAGVPFSTFTIRMAPMKPGVPGGFYRRNAQKMERVVVIGTHGLHVESGLLGHHLISGANVKSTVLAATVANLRNNLDPLDRAPAVRAMRKYMLEKYFFVAFSPWVAISARGRGPVLHVKAYVPAASLEYLTRMIRMRMLQQ